MGRRGQQQSQQYPANWGELATAAKARAGFACERCGARHGSLAVNRHNALYRVVVAAAHVHHDVWNPEAVLICLCQSCHLKMDGFQHWKTRRQNERVRHIAAGQMELVAPETQQRPTR